VTEQTPPSWPGERFGLPDDGPRSVARFGRRLGGIAIDWAVAYGLSWLFFREKDGTANPWINLLAFAVLTLLFELFSTPVSGTWYSGCALFRFAAARWRHGDRWYAPCCSAWRSRRCSGTATSAGCTTG
jgi:hypothetical protein